ncbi:hypothetical protein [Acinetobacter calcoaceticus]|uniref:hypothetical protein n=1 Tax=Acinetobacter calcoaceticus TaxID=471 RepID=UPI0018DE826C|nr:hypothetical protein [Acinetobacter calcoaceticus]
MVHAIVVELTKEINIKLSHINPDMAKVCIAIIEYVSIAPYKKPHLTFNDLYRVSPKVEDETFYDAVFYLTRKNINVLTQEFEAFHPREGFKKVPDREQILEDMKNEEFFNPFTGDELNEKEFGEQVLTYFSPSTEFVSKLNG